MEVLFENPPYFAFQRAIALRPRRQLAGIGPLAA